jgi:hypothetical protein
MATVTLWCQNGKHEWQRESQRGRKPFNCPAHQPVEEPKPVKTVSVQDVAERLQAGRRAAREAKEVEKAQERLEDLKRQSLRVEVATETEEQAYARLKEEGGVDKAADRTFNDWLLSNSRLLAETTRFKSLRSHETP